MVRAGGSKFIMQTSITSLRQISTSSAICPSNQVVVQQWNIQQWGCACVQAVRLCQRPGSQAVPASRQSLNSSNQWSCRSHRCLTTDNVRTNTHLAWRQYHYCTTLVHPHICKQGLQEIKSFLNIQIFLNTQITADVWERHTSSAVMSLLPRWLQHRQYISVQSNWQQRWTTLRTATVIIETISKAPRVALV